MVKLTQSMQQWLLENHAEIIPLIMFGHVELLTEEKWCEKCAEGLMDVSMIHLGQVSALRYAIEIVKKEGGL